ncbi:hypothetical protein MCOR27_001148 [Pyricularia oryzae]|nr:hypothetical protein MCOR01_003465 [Pyricularia oryzae]KAI6287781.1 hypothetical protein MCOR27_001148 [Pyricularia oryzae]KAI6335945.1 hypothetical protein MCOR28_009384 [Pyricularia oryzae]KAI6512021.1 hypothetical protein MCOR10_009842 [Pyricularia oryzae]
MGGGGNSGIGVIGVVSGVVTRILPISTEISQYFPNGSLWATTGLRLRTCATKLPIEASSFSWVIEAPLPLIFAAGGFSETASMSCLGSLELAAEERRKQARLEQRRPQLPLGHGREQGRLFENPDLGLELGPRQDLHNGTSDSPDLASPATHVERGDAVNGM